MILLGVESKYHPGISNPGRMRAVDTLQQDLLENYLDSIKCWDKKLATPMRAETVSVDFYFFEFEDSFIV